MNAKKILAIGGILALIGISIAVYMYNKPHKDYQEATALFSGNVATLYVEAIADNSAFLAKYLNQAVEIEGEISSVESAATLLLKPAVLCTLSEGGSTDALSVGNTITLKGRVVGLEEDLLTGDMMLTLDQCQPQ